MGLAGRAVGCVVAFSGGGVGLADRGAGLSGDVAGLSGRALGCVAGLSGGGVGLTDRGTGLSGEVAGLLGRALGCVAGLSGGGVGLSGGGVGLAGRAIGWSSCSFGFPFLSCSAAWELASPARKANANTAASQGDFDFK